MRRAAALLALTFTAGCGGSDADSTGSAAPARDVIAFASDRDGDFEIYTMAPDGTGVRQLTKNRQTSKSQSDDDEPKWSRDGRWIAFTSTRDHPTGGVERYELYVMGADGSGQRRITENDVAELVSGWTAEAEIVFWRCREGIAGCTLLVVGRDGSDERVVYETDQVLLGTWGPDDNGDVRAAITERDAPTMRFGDSVIVDLEFGGGRPGEEGLPSPNGTGLLIETDRDRNGRCMFHDCEGNATELYNGGRRLTRTRAEETHAVWSPDGTRILFARVESEEDDYELWVMNADGTCPKQLTDNGDWDWTPDWAGPRKGAGRLEC